MLNCPVCGEGNTELFSLKARQYLECTGCGSICLSSDCYVSIEGQRKRYEQHNNSLSDDGYRTFLENFINPVLKELTCNELPGGAQHLRSILDYGSGPEPALCLLLKKYASEGTILKNSCDIRGWDPFFAPDTSFFENGADLVTCLEVAEHFETPLADMKKLAGACTPGGYVAIGTMLLKTMTDIENPENVKSDREFFKNWWYRSDSTHVSFYTLEGLKRCSESAGLTFVKSVTDRAFLFRKKA